jgi:hypothetical protein
MYKRSIAIQKKFDEKINIYIFDAFVGLLQVELPYKYNIFYGEHNSEHKLI